MEDRDICEKQSNTRYGKLVYVISGSIEYNTEIKHAIILERD